MTAGMSIAPGGRGGAGRAPKVLAGRGPAPLFRSGPAPLFR
jgi:hypothetical protein